MAAELTPRENDVANLLAKGLRNQEIADKLGISYNTVAEYAGRLYRKLNVRNRTEAARVIVDRKASG